MLLRRVIEHVKAQNWTAVGLDFVIVVVGVFIGIQVANFNDLQNERRDYELALERYRQEIAVNLNSLKELETASAEKNAFVTSAYDVLLSCDETPENRAIVEKGLYEIRNTSGIDLVTTALEELTESQALLKNQSEDIRRSLKQSRKRIERMLLEADMAERMPFMEGYYENPIIAISASNERTIAVADSEISRPNRTLTLAVPLNIACEDNRLKKSFYTWERMQTIVPLLSALLQEIYEKDLETLQ